MKTIELYERTEVLKERYNCVSRKFIISLFKIIDELQEEINNYEEYKNCRLLLDYAVGDDYFSFDDGFQNMDFFVYEKRDELVYLPEEYDYAVGYVKLYNTKTGAITVVNTATIQSGENYDITHTKELIMFRLGLV